MFEKHLWKSDNLNIDGGHRPASLLKMPLFHRRFSNIFLVKTINWFLHKSNIGRKWFKIAVKMTHWTVLKIYPNDFNEIFSSN